MPQAAAAHPARLSTPEQADAHRHEMREAVALALEAAATARTIGLLGARMGAETGIPGTFNEATSQGQRCRDWRVELEEALRRQGRPLEDLDLCAGVLRDLSDAYAAAGAVKVTDAKPLRLRA